MAKNKTRALSLEFLGDLGKGGMLSSVTDLVRADKSLCIELRGTSINVYYRGGSLMKITSSQASQAYHLDFNENYFKGNSVPALPKRKINTKDDIDQWVEISPLLKRGMDQHGRRREEREFQQTVLRDNNFGSSALQTDFYICDIEYASEYGQYDMIAVHWPSLGATRKVADDRRIAFIEVKYGDKALTGKSGLSAHIVDINKFAGCRENLSRIKKEMVDVFNQKRKLGLITCNKDLRSFSDENPLLLLALVNHDPDSTTLRDVLNNLPESPNVDLHIATASFLGYGLYNQGIHPLNDTMDRFGEYINSKGP